VLPSVLDGEAIEWAASRLRRCAEAGKYLIVVSDGAPVDDSTLIENGGPYLQHHLRSVMEEIAQAGDIQLAAIGIGHDVGRYYGRGIAVTDLDDDVTQALLDLIQQLLGPQTEAGLAEPQVR
jgi:cobaltochelatase CobT